MQHSEQRQRQQHRQRWKRGSDHSFTPTPQKRNVVVYPTMAHDPLSNNWLFPPPMSMMVDPQTGLRASGPIVYHPMVPSAQPTRPSTPRKSSFSHPHPHPHSTGMIQRNAEPISPPNPLRMARMKSAPSFPKLSPAFVHERVGAPYLRIFRVKLPPHLTENAMDDIIDHAENHATNLEDGWKTDLYSLTKCDMACRDIPGMKERTKPVFDYICHAIQVLYGCQKVIVDKNQPHILKYSADAGHTGGKDGTR
mmetsp:Transcript_23327/g.37970  ORF Transcript_23327/g.37970 Transcript_23327/m.37970 type:complete len:251 (-) Transcript_23327:1348-2100(-)